MSSILKRVPQQSDCLLFIICHLRGLKTCTHEPQARSGVDRGGLDVVSLHRSSGWWLIYISRGHHQGGVGERAGRLGLVFGAWVQCKHWIRSGEQYYIISPLAVVMSICFDFHNNTILKHTNFLTLTQHQGPY